MGKIHADSRYRYRATAAERRMYGGATVTEFFVYRDEDKGDASKWRIVRGYGRTPGERKTDAIRRSGLLEEPAPGARDASRAAEIRQMSAILRHAGYDRPDMRARQLYRRGFDARTLRAELVEARRRDPRRR